MKDGAHKEKDWKDPTNLVLFRLWGLLGGGRVWKIKRSCRTNSLEAVVSCKSCKFFCVFQPGLAPHA